MNVPKLRFKEFSGEWGTQPVGSVCDYIVPGRNKPDSFDGDIPWINTPDIAQNQTIYVSKNKLNITKLEALRIGSKVVPKDAVIISCVGDLGLVAITGTEVVLNQQLHAFIPKNEINFRFLAYELTTKKKYMEKVATRTSLLYMNKENCNSIPISFSTLPEQTKIANFLTMIDERINQLTRKKVLMTQYKQGVMQQIFSQKLRFKNDNGEDFGDWIECFLIDFAQNGNLTNGVFNDPNKVGKGYKLINVLDMYIDGWINEDNLNLIDLDEKEFLKNKVQNGDVFFTRSSLVKEGIAFSNIYMGHSDDITYDGHLIKMTPNKEVISPIFLNYLLKCSDIRTQLVSRGKTATMTTIGQKDIASVTVKYPCLAEQTKIANFLTTLDEKIQHITQQIEATKQYKQGLLQQMFV